MSTGDGGGSVHGHVCRAARVFMQCGGVVSGPITWPGQGDALLISRKNVAAQTAGCGYPNNPAPSSTLISFFLRAHADLWPPFQAAA